MPYEHENMHILLFQKDFNKLLRFTLKCCSAVTVFTAPITYKCIKMLLSSNFCHFILNLERKTFCFFGLPNAYFEINIPQILFSFIDCAIRKGSCIGKFSL